jgi:hypothetical protein
MYSFEGDMQRRKRAEYRRVVAAYKKNKVFFKRGWILG